MKPADNTAGFLLRLALWDLTLPSEARLALWDLTLPSEAHLAYLATSAGVIPKKY
jgi:hypothetical protein